MNERLQKVLARTGMGSRRLMEDWIRAGRVEVNGRIAQLGQRVGDQDRIRVDGRPLRIVPVAQSRHRVILYNKPEGEVSSRKDEHQRPTVFDHLPDPGQGRWLNIGRLDVNTSGLLLFTTDGELANRLTHPSFEIEREYAVRVFGTVDDALLARLCSGVELEDGAAAFTRIQDAGGQGRNHWYHVVLNEGRHREVRRLWESQGVQVSRLIRLRFGPIELGRDTRPGNWRELNPAELRQLYQSVNLQPPEPPRAGKDSPARPHKPARRRRS